MKVLFITLWSALASEPRPLKATRLQISGQETEKIKKIQKNGESVSVSVNSIGVVSLCSCVDSILPAPGTVRVPEHAAGQHRVPDNRGDSGNGGPRAEGAAGEFHIRARREAQDGGVHDVGAGGADGGVLHGGREQAAVLERAEAGDAVVAGIRQQSFPIHH